MGGANSLLSKTDNVRAQRNEGGVLSSVEDAPKSIE